MLDRVKFKELDIRTMGDILAILKLTKESPVSLSSLESHTKPPTAKLPQLNSEMTSEKFRKFRIDWDVFTEIINLTFTQTNVQLCNCANETVQNFIINTYPEFFNTNPSKLFDMLEELVTQKSNPMVRRISFLSSAQSQSESIQNYLIRRRSKARDCNFICSGGRRCHSEMSQ